MNSTKGVINIAQSAANSQLQEEVMFLRGQNEALFKMISYLSEQSGGTITIPRNFGELVIGSSFTFDNDADGNYVAITKRDEVTESIAATSDGDAPTTIV